MDRCHRIGQTKPVHIHGLATTQSVERRILKRAYNKLKLGHVVIGKGQFHQEQKLGNDQFEESDLWYRLSKPRRVNCLRFVVIQDHALEDHEGDSHHLLHHRHSCVLSTGLLFANCKLNYQLQADIPFSIFEKWRDRLNRAVLKDHVFLKKISNPCLP